MSDCGRFLKIHRITPGKRQIFVTPITYSFRSVSNSGLHSPSLRPISSVFNRNTLFAQILPISKQTIMENNPKKKPKKKVDRNGPRPCNSAKAIHNLLPQKHLYVPPLHRNSTIQPQPTIHSPKRLGGLRNSFSLPSVTATLHPRHPPSTPSKATISISKT